MKSNPKGALACSNRRSFLKFAGKSGIAAGVGMLGFPMLAFAEQELKIGIISPLTGAWTVYGKSHLAGAELAVDELNEKGGILGRRIKLVIADSKTEPRVVVEQANRLIRSDRVEFIAGTFSSAERNAAGPIIQSANKVLIYPTFYEGQTQKYYPGVCNPNIFMTGCEPTQQVWPHLDYVLKNVGKKFFMIGSDYAWPRVTNEFTKQKLNELGGSVVGEEYIPFNTPQYESVLRDIAKAKPDVIFHSLTGSDTINFRKQFVAAGMKKDFALWTVDDEEVVTSALGPEVASGGYVSFDYFMGIDNPNNDKFLKAISAKFGNDLIVNTVGVGMYNAIHMAALAYEKEGHISTQDLRRGLAGLRFDGAPQGVVTMRAKDNQLVAPSYLMQVNDAWDSPRNMFKQVEFVAEAIPQDAQCNNLPLNSAT